MRHERVKHRRVALAELLGDAATESLPQLVHRQSHAGAAGKLPDVRRDSTTRERLGGALRAERKYLGRRPGQRRGLRRRRSRGRRLRLSRCGCRGRSRCQCRAERGASQRGSGEGKAGREALVEPARLYISRWGGGPSLRFDRFAVPFRVSRGGLGYVADVEQPPELHTQSGVRRPGKRGVQSLLLFASFDRCVHPSHHVAQTIRRINQRAIIKQSMMKPPRCQ